MSEEFNRPPLKITLESGRTIKMSYGLEMDLRRWLPDPEIALQIAINDPVAQDYVIRRCLSPVSTMVTNPNEELTKDMDDVTLEDSEKIILWAVEHILYFFVKRAKSLGEMSTRFKVPTLPSPSTNGSDPSPSTTPSAGPTE